MTPTTLRHLPATDAATLPPLLQALWHDAHSDWAAAHTLAQDIDTPDAARAGGPHLKPFTKAAAPYLASEMWASRNARPLPPIPKARPNPLEGPDFSRANKRQAEGASFLPEAEA
jgi:hypothetical protein